MSKSKWEESMFGGYQKVLMDYPIVEVPYKINLEAPKEDREDLGYFCSGKLLKLFLLRVKEYDLRGMLMYNATRESGMFGDTLKATPSGIADCVRVITSRVDDELLNMFVHFKKTILGSTFSVDLPPEKCKGGGSGDSEESEEKESKKESKKGTPKEIKDAMDELDKVALLESKRKGGDGISAGNLAKETKFVTIPLGREVTFTATEELYASQLVNRLDVSFEPEVDVIRNLQLGKMDTSKIAQIEAGFHHIYQKTEEDQKTRPFSVCILCDESGSMGGLSSIDTKHFGQEGCTRSDNQYFLVKILFKTFSQIMPRDKIYVYGHSGSHSPEIYVYHDKFNPNFERTIAHQAETLNSQNYDGPVIEELHKRVRSQDDGTILFINLSDGSPCGYEYGGIEANEELKKVVEKCRRDKFITLGIGLKHYGVKHLYHYNTVITNFKDMVKQVSGLVNIAVKTEFQG